MRDVRVRALRHSDISLEKKVLGAMNAEQVLRDRARQMRDVTAASM
jgi:hypothetical protein